MPFIAQGKTNWKFLLIVIILAIIVGGGIWIYKHTFCLDCVGGPPIKPPEKKVIITTDKTEYELGETVGITIKNNSSIRNFIDYPIIENLVNNQWIPSGSVVWPGCWVTGGLVYLPLESNSSNSYRWDQKIKWCSSDMKDLNTYSKEVLSGTYRVKSRMITRTKSEAEDPNNISGQPAETIYSKEFTIKEKYETADWKTYSNKEYGFEVKYPQGLEITEGKPAGIPTVDFSNPVIGGVVFSISIFPDSNSLSLSFGSDWKKQGELSIDGHQASELTATHLSGSKIFTSTVYLITDKNTAVDFEDPNFSKISQEELNQILSTFKFIESYTACGCGCCGGVEPTLKCLYHSKGDDIQKIIEEDKQAAQNPLCPQMGCSHPIKYIYCD